MLRCCSSFSFIHIPISVPACFHTPHPPSRCQMFRLCVYVCVLVCLCMSVPACLSEWRRFLRSRSLSRRLAVTQSRLRCSALHRCRKFLTFQRCPGDPSPFRQICGLRSASAGSQSLYWFTISITALTRTRLVCHFCQLTINSHRRGQRSHLI